MPVTKTAKRALRGSKRKSEINAKIAAQLAVLMRQAKKTKSAEKIRMAMSLADRAAKKKAIHANKASRIKKALAKLMPKVSVKTATKKTVKKTPVKKSK